jgi:hypothetical protein
MSPTYHTSVSKAGPVRYGQVPGSLGVLEAPDKPMPIGMANCVGWYQSGLAVWRLTVHGADVPGNWVIIDRRFVAIEGDPAGSGSLLPQERPAATGS